MLTRILYGLRIDLEIGIIATVATLLYGVAIGALAGYYGGWLDTILMRFLDILIAFPQLVLAIGVIAMLGQGLINMYIAIGVVGWITFARLARGEVLVAKQLDYALAARAIGARDRRVIWRHLMPNVITPAIIFAMSDVVLNILFAAALGFLGLGIQPPSPDWGLMISEEYSQIINGYWWPVVYPSLAIASLVVAVNLIADSLQGVLSR